MKKGTYIYFILFVVLLIGLSLLLYPTVSDYVNSLNQSRAITSYVDEVAKMDENKYQMTWDQAIEYNRNLLTRKNNFILTPELEEQYYELLDVAGTGIMGYVEIPSINCTLPIYHGVDETVLQIAVGHIEWTSLPVGGESTHAVLSGPATERIKNSVIKELILLDTVPVPEENMLDKYTVLPVAPVFAEAIERIFADKPVSPLFA